MSASGSRSRARPQPPDGEANPPPGAHPYRGRVVVLATKHDKLDVVAPPLRRDVGLVVMAAAVDTDRLGTFSGEVPRPGPPLETAVAKARLGMAAAGLPLGLASEGTVGPHRGIPFLTADRELVVLVDDDAGTVVWEAAVSVDVVTANTTAAPGGDLAAFLTQADFPSHGLIARPNQGPPRPVHKGIRRLDVLETALVACAAASPDGLARIETDLRAHHHPTRRVVIAEAAGRLAARLARRCPGCGAPGWGRVEVVYGVPCAWCGTEVDQARAEIDGCPACPQRSVRAVVDPDTRADPGTCPFCNP